MRKIVFLLILLSLFLIGISTLAKTPKATVNNHTFNLYIAKTSKDKEVGLAKYSNLPQNQGMLFLFGTASNYSFWMKDMQFPIDIIFIRNNRIVVIYQNVQPPQKGENLTIYHPQELSDTVLEINAGLSKKYNFKKGNPVRIENL